MFGQVLLSSLRLWDGNIFLGKKHQAESWKKATQKKMIWW